MEQKENNLNQTVTLAKKKNSKQRLPWLDDIKMFIMFTVFLGHAGGGILKGYAPLPTLDIVTLYAMPLFVLLSGYSNYNSLNNIKSKETWLKVLIKQFEHLKIPEISACIVTYLLTFELYNANFLYGNYWFFDMLLFIAVLYASIVFLSSFFKSFFWLNIIIFSSISFWINLWSVGDMCSFYIIGLILRRYNLIEKFSNKLSLILLLITTCILFTYHYSIHPELHTIKYSFYYIKAKDTLFSGMISLYFWRQVLGLLIGLCIILIFKNFSKKYNWFSWCGSKTLGLYLFHVMIMNIFKTWSSPFYNSTFFKLITTEPIIAYSTLILIVFIVFWLIPIVMIKLTERWKLTRYLFEGKRNI